MTARESCPRKLDSTVCCSCSGGNGVGLRTYMGSFTPTGTGNGSIIGIGFEPKMIKFEWGYATSLASNTAVAIGHYEASTGNMHLLASYYSVGTSGRYVSRSACIGLTTTGAAYTLGTVTSTNADGFDYNISIFGGAQEFFFECWG